MVSAPRPFSGSLRSVQSNEDLRSMLAHRRKSSLSDRDKREMSEDVQRLLEAHSLIKGIKGKQREQGKNSIVATIEEEPGRQDGGGTIGLVSLASVLESEHEIMGMERSTTSMSANTTTTGSEDGGAALLDAFPAPPRHTPRHGLPGPSPGSFLAARGRSKDSTVKSIRVPDHALFLSSSTPNLKSAKRSTDSFSPPMPSTPVSPAFSPLLPPSVPLPPLPPALSPSTDSTLSSLNPPPSIPLPPLPPLPSPILTLSLYNEQQRSFPLHPTDFSDHEASPIGFDEILSSPLRKRSLSTSPTLSGPPHFVRPRSRSSQLLSTYISDGTEDLEDGYLSQESENDMETSISAIAWRAGVMKTLRKDVKSSEGEENARAHKEGAMTPPPRTRNSSFSPKHSSWQASKAYRYRPSYKLIRKNSDNIDLSERDSSSEEEELFDLSFDSGSATSGSTPSFSPFSSYRRSTSSSTTISSGNHQPLSTPKPCTRLSREYFPLSPPTLWDNSNDGPTGQSGSEIEGSEHGAAWSQNEKAWQQEILAKTKDFTPKPERVLSKIPSLSNVKRPQASLLPMRRPSNASSTSTSSTSFDSIKFTDRLSRSSAESSFSSNRKSMSSPGMERSSVASTDSSFSSKSELRTSFEELDTPSPLPNKSFNICSTSMITATPEIERPVFIPSTRSLPLDRAKTPSLLPKLSSPSLVRSPISPGQIPRPVRSSSQPHASPTSTLSPKLTTIPTARPIARSPQARLSSLPYLGSGNGSVSKLILPGKVASASAAGGTAAGSISRIRPPGGRVKPLQLSARSSTIQS